MRDRIVSQLAVTRVTMLIGMALCLIASTARSNEICTQAGTRFSKELFVCNLEIISSVAVIFNGELLKNYKADYEKLTRLRLRNDLSMIRHENIKTMDPITKLELTPSDMRKRGYVICLVWTVGDDYPAAMHVECTLFGHGDFSIREDFSSSMLGFSNSDKSNELARRMIRDNIEDLSADFLEARDRFNQ